MILFSIETLIERPVGEVFAYVTDPDKLATWQTNTVSAVQEGDGPLGLGTRLREVHRASGGKELASVVNSSTSVVSDVEKATPTPAWGPRSPRWAKRASSVPSGSSPG